MTAHTDRTVPLERLRWRLDPATLPFATTADLEPGDQIIGQSRGVEAFRFGMGLHRKGYNIFVTGEPGTGRLATVTKLLENLSNHDGTPDDLCYVNNFKNPEAPILLRFKAGDGARFRKAVQEFLAAIKREAPQLFESEEYIARKNELAEAHEKQILSFYKSVEEKVKDTGLAVVRMQMGPFQRPDVLPVVDGEPKRMVDLEDLVEKGRFPRDEFERLREVRGRVKEEIEHIVHEVRALQKEFAAKHEEVDRLMFRALAQDLMQPLRAGFPDAKVQTHLEAVIEHMVEDLDNIRMMGRPPQPQQGMPFAPPPAELVLQPYGVNLIVDNAGLTGPPVIIESYPTYRNLFGSVERVTDRFGYWRTDFSRIKVGSFVRANGGFLVLHLLDAIMEPGVWQTLKRSLKTEKIEVETYDPFYFFTGAGLKPEPIDMEVKVVVIGEPRLYHLLLHYDSDTAKIFKVRADYESSMDRTEASVMEMARFLRAETERKSLLPLDASAVAAVVEHAVRMTGRQEKLTTAFPLVSDLLSEADWQAREAKAETVSGLHVQAALDARIRRANQVEEHIQELIDRGTLFVDTTGAVVGQVNGLAVYSLGDYMFGKPSRITAVTAMGKEGIINIEREAELSGPTHNKGVLILAGYLRRHFAQNRPLSLTASIAFEQSYGGVDGDSASSTELYALLSSLAEAPIRQDVAVTGSVNQKGEVQPIGGVNEKIEGFWRCCKQAGLTGEQGVLIPEANVKDLMLEPEVVEAVSQGRFHVWSVRTVEQGIEILTSLPAGERDAEGNYPEDSLFGRVDHKLKTLAEGLRDFAKTEENDVKTGEKSAAPCGGDCPTR